MMDANFSKSNADSCIYSEETSAILHYCESILANPLLKNIATSDKM